jgi:hypothetical protein
MAADNRHGLTPLDAKAEPMTYRETGGMDGASALFPESFHGL